MSRSPKYSFAQLGTKVRDQLERDQDARRRRRETAEARLRDRVLAEGRAEILQRRQALARMLAGVGDEAPRSGVDIVDSALEDAGRHVREAGTLTELGAAVHELDRVERGIRRLQTRAAEQARRTNADRIAVLTAMLADADAETRARFDPGDRAAVDSRLDRLRSATEPATADIDELAVRVQQHLDRVAARRAEHDEQRRRAAARVEQLASRLDDLRADGRTAHVPLRDGDRAADALTMLRAQFSRGEFADVIKFGTALERRIDVIESDLDAVIDQLAERRTILTSLVRALPEVGFSVDPGSLTESADGAIGLRASRPGGDTVAVIVEAEPGEGHRVLYASDAVRHEERLGRGDTACGNLLEVVSLLQDSAGQDGVVLSAVTWDGRDGQRQPPAVNSRRVPPSESQAGRHRENPSWRP